MSLPISPVCLLVLQLWSAAAVQLGPYEESNCKQTVHLASSPNQWLCGFTTRSSFTLMMSLGLSQHRVGDYRVGDYTFLREAGKVLWQALSSWIKGNVTSRDVWSLTNSRDCKSLNYMEVQYWIAGLRSNTTTRSIWKGHYMSKRKIAVYVSWQDVTQWRLEYSTTEAEPSPLLLLLLWVSVQET